MTYPKICDPTNGWDEDMGYDIKTGSKFKKKLNSCFENSFLNIFR